MRPDSPLFVFFTSGSAGPAKGVTHTLDTLGWMAANLVRASRSRRDVVLTTTSHSYLGGTSWGLMALAAGAPLAIATSPGGRRGVLADPVGPADADVDAALHALRPRRRGAGDPSRTSPASATSAPQVTRHRATRATFCRTGRLPMVEVYGMTEAIGIAMTPPGGPNKPGSTGPPGAGVSLSVRNEDGTELTAVRSEGCGSGTGEPWSATGIVPRPPPRCSRTVGSTRATWCGSTATATSGSPGAQADHHPRRIQHRASGGGGCAARASGRHPCRGGGGARPPARRERVGLRGVALRCRSSDREQLIDFAADRVGYKAPDVVEVLDEIPGTRSARQPRRYQAHGRRPPRHRRHPLTLTIAEVREHDRERRS